MALYSNNRHKCFDNIVCFNEISLYISESKIYKMVRKKSEIKNDSIKKKRGKKNEKRIERNKTIKERKRWWWKFSKILKTGGEKEYLEYRNDFRRRKSG